MSATPDGRDAPARMHENAGETASEAGAWAPRLAGSDRPSHKFSSAVRADVAQDVLDAIGAESAFVAANPGVWRARREIYVAQFAVWA